MKLTISPTADIVVIDDVSCRRWTGTTDKGVPVHVFVRSLSPQTLDLAALADFEAELQRLPQPQTGTVTLEWMGFGGPLPQPEQPITSRER